MTTNPLLTWREKQGLSQTEAAELIGVKQPTWSSWEQKSKAPGLTHALKIEEVTGGEVKAAMLVRERRLPGYTRRRVKPNRPRRQPAPIPSGEAA